MKIMQWLIFAVGLMLIIVRGLWSNVFVVDVSTIVILFILSIPFVAQYLRKAKIAGAEFEFKDEIRETEKLVQLSVEEARKAERAGKKILPFETFSLSAARELLDSDPVLALAALRIEIERKLKSAGNLAFLDLSMDKFTIPKVVEAMRRKGVLSLEQTAALRKIVNMCNKAIHGSSVSGEEASGIIDLAEELNKTFSIGYSIAFSQNTDYAAHGLLCEWEHCIEWMPLTEENTEFSCPVFGHNCPGGVEKVSECGKTLEDISTNRFIKKSKST